MTARGAGGGICQRERRGQLPAGRLLAGQPGRDPARGRAPGTDARASGPVRPAAPEPPAADQRDQRRRQDDGRDPAARPGGQPGRERVHHRPGRALRVPRLADPGRGDRPGSATGRARSTAGTSPDPAGVGPEKVDYLLALARAAARRAPSRAATATASPTWRRTCSASRSARCTRAARLTGEEPRELLLAARSCNDGMSASARRGRSGSPRRCGTW